MPFLPPCAAAAAPTATTLERVPVSASTAVRDLLAAPAAGTVLAAFPAAVYVRLAGGDVLAVVTADGLRLPLALTVAAPSRSRPFAQHRAGAPAQVRDGDLHVGGLRYAPVRWWSPRTTTDGALVLDAVRRLTGELPPPLHTGAVADRLATAVAALQDALGRAHHDRARAAGNALLGLGPGLTPAGDDVLAGALVTCAHLADTGPAVAATAAALGRHVVQRAARTTALSAALLRHAAQGRAAEPVLGLLDALTGRREVGPALSALRAVGHTSGADTAAGVLAAASALLACGRPVQP